MTVGSRVRLVAVAIHDVEPATYERCALIRDWLEDHGVDRATLLVIPARDLHPFSERRSELADWLRERHERGDAIAQHGFIHGPTRPRTHEFSELDGAATRERVEAGRRTLRLAGLEPRGFVAPGYAYTAALHEVLAGCFDWWATLLTLRRGGDLPRRALAPALSLTTASLPRRVLSPTAMRAGSLASGRVLRLDLHPCDLGHPRHVRAAEFALRRAARRIAVTYEELC